MSDPNQPPQGPEGEGASSAPPPPPSTSPPPAAWDAVPAPGGFSPAGRPQLASFGQRFGAVLLDGLIIGGVMIAVMIVLGILGAVLGSIADVLGLLAGLLAIALYLAVIVGYAVLEAGPYGQTPGKHVVGIRVITAGGQNLSTGQSIGRWAVKSFISGAVCYLGYLWALWDGERRTWHDMIVDTRVITATHRAPSMIAVVRAPLEAMRNR